MHECHDTASEHGLDGPLHQERAQVRPVVLVESQCQDAAATLKLNGRCDFVMAEVVKHLGMKLPEYTTYNDPLLSYATHLHEKEEHTTSRKTLIESRPAGHTHLSMEASVSPTGVITEVGNFKIYEFHLIKEYCLSEHVGNITLV